MADEPEITNQNDFSQASPAAQTPPPTMPIKQSAGPVWSEKPPVPNPAMQDLAHSAMLGHAFKTIATGEQTDPQTGQNTPQKPGQFFRSILAGVLLGSAAGAKSKTLTGGFANGVDAQQARQQQQAKRQRQQKQQDFENQMKQKQDERAGIASADEHTLHQAQTQHETLSNIELGNRLHEADEATLAKKVAASNAIEDMYKKILGAESVKFPGADGPTSSVSAVDFMKAVNQDPSLLHPTDSSNYERHFTLIPPDASKENIKFENGQWLDAETGQPAHIASLSQIHGYDVPTHSLDKPVKVTGQTLMDANPGLKGLLDPKGSYSMPGSGIVANHTAGNKLISDDLKIRKEKADARLSEAKAGEEELKRKEAAKQVQDDPSVTGEAYFNTLPTSQQALVKSLGDGRMIPERISYLLSRNPKLLADVARSYPDLSTAKLEAYPKTYNDFTSGKTSKQLNAGATALLHLHELQQLNTYESRLPGSKDHQRYENKLDTVSAELASFYVQGNAPTEKEISTIKKTLGATFNRDAAITTQAQSMGDKFDSLEQTWKDAAPSPRFQDPMPHISDASKTARAALDPRYAERLKTESSGNRQVPQGGRPILKDGNTVGYIGADGKRVNF